MSQQVRVERDLKFKGVASHTDNVEGRFSTREVIHKDDFLGLAIDTTNDYTNTADAGNTATIVAPHLLRLTKDTDNEGINIATGVCFYGNYNPACEARVRINDVTATCFNFGFNDAVDDQPPAASTGAKVLTMTASDAVLWHFDTDCTTSNWLGVSNYNGAENGAVHDSAHTEANASWATLRIELEKRGTLIDARYYLNTAGKAINPITDFVGYEANAVKAGVALCVMAGLEGRDTGTDTVDIDYIKIWSERY